VVGRDLLEQVLVEGLAVLPSGCFGQNGKGSGASKAIVTEGSTPVI
jgi:hypothetical protein